MSIQLPKSLKNAGQRLSGYAKSIIANLLLNVVAVRMRRQDHDAACGSELKRVAKQV